MKSEILDTMRDMVRPTIDSNTFLKSDFIQDLESLDNYDSRFFWRVDKSSTSLQKIGKDYINEQLRFQMIRIFWFRDFYTFGSIFLNVFNDSRFFFYDGKEFSRVTAHECRTIYNALMSDLYDDYLAMYPEEAKIARKPLPVKLKCSLEYVKECLRYAESLNDTSLLDCLHRMRHRSRCAVDQRVNIYRDFAPYSFYFEEMIRDKVKMNGGIIFSPYSSERRWSIHT